MATETKASPKKKGTSKTEAIIGSGASALNTAVNALAKAVVELQKLPEESDRLTLLIADKEAKLEELVVQFDEKKRSLLVDLDLSMKENTKALVEGHLQALGFIAVEQSAYSNLHTELQLLKDQKDREVAKEVAIATNAMKAKHDADLRVLHAEFGQKEATNTATIQSLSQQLALVKQQNDELFKQLNAERQAGTDRAKANAVGAINVSSQK